MEPKTSFLRGLISESSPLSSKRWIAIFLIVFLALLISWVMWYSLVNAIALDHYIITLIVVAILLTVWVMSGAATTKDIVLGLQSLKIGGIAAPAANEPEEDTKVITEEKKEETQQ